jgi:AcrR family transcriptional regulator
LLARYSNDVPAVKTRTQLAAEETQRTIVAAATRLFVERGYHATSIGAIAGEAGVAVQTIYNAIGSKRDVLSRVLDHAVAGERAGVPVARFMGEAAECEPDPRRVIGLLVSLWREAFPRTAPVFRIIREAAASDPEIAALERARSAQRLANYHQAGRLLADRGVLRPGVTVEQAAAAIFAIGHPESYRALVLDGDWSEDDWAAWVQQTLEAALLGNPADARAV